MKRILVTAIGTITATCIVQELRKSEEKYYIIGTDTNEANEIATSRDVDEFFKFPSVIDDQEEYLNFVLNFCKDKRIDYLFSVIDEEVVNYSEHRTEFEKIGVKLCIPNKELINTCHYKDKFSQWIEGALSEYYIRHYKKEDTDIRFPLFVKPITGRASNGCRIIYNKSELHEQRDLDQCVIQDYVMGDIVTADVVQCFKSHKIQIIQRLELLRNKNGCGVAVKIIQDPRIDEACRKVADKLSLNGVINVEFFVTDEFVKIIEINPRFSAGSYFSFLSGCNLAETAMCIADGVDFAVNPVSVGKNYARRYETYEM